jgi:hypothetical protein
VTVLAWLDWIKGLPSGLAIIAGAIAAAVALALLLLVFAFAGCVAGCAM